jgi:maltooligosyltrehalose synthase
MTAWGETRLRLPPAAAERTFVELLSGRPVVPRNGTITLAEVLEHFPHALLLNEAQS